MQKHVTTSLKLYNAESRTLGNLRPLNKNLTFLTLYRLYFEIDNNNSPRVEINANCTK